MTNKDTDKAIWLKGLCNLMLLRQEDWLTEGQVAAIDRAVTGLLDLVDSPERTPAGRSSGPNDSCSREFAHLFTNLPEEHRCQS